MALAVALLVAALAITPHTCEIPQQRRASVALPPTTTSPALVAAAVPDAALGRRTTLAVGMALCNDVLLLLMLVPMLPHLLPAGSSALALSFVFSAKDAAQLLLAPLAGALTLHFGARRTLAASLFAVAAATVAFAEARGLRALLAARALQGAASAALMSGGLTLVAETHPPAERASAIARAQAGLGVGAAIGPVFGGLMLEAAGRRGAFYSAAALVLLNGVAVIAVGRGDPQPARRSKPAAERRPAAPAARQLLSLLGNRAIATVALGIFAEYAAGGCYDGARARGGPRAALHVSRPLPRPQSPLASISPRPSASARPAPRSPLRSSRSPIWSHCCYSRAPSTAVDRVASRDLRRPASRSRRCRCRC